MTVLVDTSVLIDVLGGSAAWAPWSTQALAAAANAGRVAINPVIYAELAAGFARIEDLDAALAPGLFNRLEVPWQAAFLAGRAFVAYRRRGGARNAPLPDHFIGAHAAVAGLTLLTRDPVRVRDAFPTVRLIAPT